MQSPGLRRMQLPQDVGMIETEIRERNKQHHEGNQSGLVLFQSHWQADPSKNGETCK